MHGLLARLPAAVAYLSGPDLVIEFANDVCRDLAGERDLVGRPLREAIPEAAEAGRLAMLERILRTGETAQGRETEVRVLRHGRAEHLFMDFCYQPVRDDAGTVTGILLYAADVTAHVRDRHRLEELAAELTATQERYQTLFETMPLGVVHYHADGSIIAANPAAARLLGLDRAELTRWPLRTARQAVREDGTPLPPGELPVVTALRTGQVVTDRLIGLPHGRTGEVRWLRVTAVPDARDSHGRPQRAYGIFTDVTEQLRAEAVVRESTVMLGRLRDANVLGVLLSSEEGILEANDAFLDIVGYDRAEVEAGRMSYQMLTPPEWAEHDRQALAQLRRDGAVQPYDKEYLHRDGHRVPVLVGAAVVSRRPLRWVTYVVDLSARQRAEQERTELLVRERAARSEAGQARERLRFLMQGGALAAATGDRDQFLQQVTQLVVPGVADYCLVYLPAGDGRLQAVAVTHRDPARAAMLGRLRDVPIPVTGPLLAQIAYTSGQTQLVKDIRTELARWAQTEPVAARVLRQVRPASAIAVPLTAAGQRAGVMVLGRGTGRARFVSSDLEIIQELAHCLATGLAAANTFAVEHTIAETLQRSLLPASLPEFPGVDIAVRYLPATAGADIGGDWYDAFTAGGDRLGLVIGDVVGHSIASASIMGQIRNILRAYAIQEPSPSRVLRRTNAAMARLLPTALATVACAVLDPATGELRYASAGHPPPLLTSTEGTRYLDDAGGMMLGVDPQVSYRSGHCRLPPGAGLLFYTDGLVESRERDLIAGLATLASALTGQAGHTAEEVCACAQNTLPGTGTRQDDVCLLAIARQG